MTLNVYKARRILKILAIKPIHLNFRPRDFNPGGIKRVFNRREDDADHKKGRL